MTQKLTDSYKITPYTNSTTHVTLDYVGTIAGMTRYIKKILKNLEQDCNASIYRSDGRRCIYSTLTSHDFQGWQ